MNDGICKGLIFKSEKMTFEVCYSYINTCPDRISIKGKINPKTSNKETYVFFQFYKEILCKKESTSEWILDKARKNSEPYYCLSSVWKYKFADKPKYDCVMRGGKIIFNTFIAEVKANGNTRPYTYKVLLGFSWGMTSNDGIKIQKIPIENIDKSRLKDLVNLLQVKYLDDKFEIENDLIKGSNSDIVGMW